MYPKSVSIVFLLLSCLIMTSLAHNRHWQTDDAGVTRWDVDCEFPGKEFNSVPATGEHQCGHLCIANTRCTHYTFNTHRVGGDHHHGIGKQMCYMKHSDKALEEISLKRNSGVYCGWIAGRSSQKYHKH